MKSLIVAAMFSLASLASAAQTPTPVLPAPTQITNLFAAGASYNVNAVPNVSGTGLYAHLVVPSTSTYAFSVLDILPNTIKPFTVSTNIGAGLAQKFITIGNVPIYIPTSAGISLNGQNTGWQWNAGALASIHIKGQYYVLPSVRVLKSSVSNGTGYQPILGVLVGWGK